MNSAMETTAERVVKSVYSRDEFHPVALRDFIEGLAWELDATRQQESGSFEAAVAGYFDSYSVELPEGQSAESLANELWEEVSRDSTYDSELAMARRAAWRVLDRFFGSTVEIKGWFRGAAVSQGFDRFILTGDACERCGVNPKAHGLGGGVRCMDTENCGWWFCR